MPVEKKIRLLIYYNSLNASGGVERVIANLLNRLGGKYAITILVKDDGKSFYSLPQNIEISSLGISCKLDMKNKLSRVATVGRGYFSSIKAIRKYLRDKKFDWIYTATPMQCFEMVSAGYGHKVIATEHASAAAYNSIYQLIKNYSYKRVHKVVSPTTLDTKVYEEKGYPVVYIPHLTTFTAKKLGNWETKTFLNVGRITADKQQIILLEMWKEFQKRPNADQWRLVIVGEGEEKQRLTDYIKDNELRNVTLAGSTSRIEEYYSNATYFLFTSRMEGFGMVLLEAMAYGVPCISFDCPSGPRDIIKNGKNGWLVPCGDKSSFEDVLAAVAMQTQSDYSAYSREAYQTIKEWPNQSILNQWDSIFE